METTKEKKKLKITQEDIMKLLDKSYEWCKNGVPKVSKSVEELSQEYLSKYKDIDEAIKKMISNQIIKCSTSGFLTGLGGVITLPVTIPANIGSVLYVQMRMIACAAYMCGYDLNSDEVQTLIYACLAGVSVSEIVKKTTTVVGIKLATTLVNKIPKTVLGKINKAVSFKLFTKFSAKGVVAIGKLVPVVGGVIGATFDAVETKYIANRAFKWFYKNDYSIDEKEPSDNEIIDAECVVRE